MCHCWLIGRVMTAALSTLGKKFSYFCMVWYSIKPFLMLFLHCFRSHLCQAILLMHSFFFYLSFYHCICYHLYCLFANISLCILLSFFKKKLRSKFLACFDSATFDLLHWNKAACIAQHLQISPLNTVKANSTRECSKSRDFLIMKTSLCPCGCKLRLHFLSITRHFFSLGKVPVIPST